MKKFYKFTFQYYPNGNRRLKPLDGNPVILPWTTNYEEVFKSKIQDYEKDYFNLHFNELERKVLVVERKQGKVGRISFVSKEHVPWKLKNWTNPICFNRYQYDYSLLKRGDCISVLINMENQY